MEHLFNHAQKRRRIGRKNKSFTHVDKCHELCETQKAWGFLERKAKGMFKVNIYIETDGQDKRKRYRAYSALAEFTTKNNATVTRKVHGTENATGHGIMLAALAASLKLLVKPCRITIYMDCDYVTGSICNGRVYEWMANGWKTLRGEPSANREEWKEVMRLLERHEPAFAPRGRKYKTELQDDIRGLKSQGMEYRQQAIGGGESYGN